MKRFEHIATLAQALALATTRDDIAALVAAHASAAVGAQFSNLALYDPVAGSLRLYHHSSLPSQIANRYSEVPLDAPYPICVAARHARPVLLPDVRAYEGQFTSLIEDTVASGLQATASLPLARADDRTLLGAIGFAWSEPVTFDETLLKLIQAVADLCAGTLERAALYDAEHELILELQSRLLGPLPELPGLATAARYLPASRALAVGGDWYEAMQLDSGVSAFVVGDVAGHGARAAADMAMVRGIITALLEAGTAPSDVFDHANAILMRRPDLLLVTTALALVDCVGDSVTFATAGHPPPLVRYPDGTVVALDSAASSLLGIPSGTVKADTLPFPPESQLLIYTDGLVERRDRPFDAGIAILAATLANVKAPPAEVIDAVVATFFGDGAAAEDDIALVVVERVANR